MLATSWRALGALIGLGTGVFGGIGLREALGSGDGIAALGVAALAAAWIVLYVVARTQRTAETAGGELMPGLLLGANTGVNAVLIEALAGVLVAIVVAGVLVLAVIQPLARTDAYQALVGWANWVLPMSWPIVALGLVFLLLSALLHLAAKLSGALRITGLQVDGKTGTVVQRGGAFGNANLAAQSTGYNMGNFAFLRTRATEDASLVEHEAGHTLNLAAFGWAFHLIGALDENVLGGGHDAYSELFAESNVPPVDRHGPAFPLWGAPSTPAGA